MLSVDRNIGSRKERADLFQLVFNINYSNPNLKGRQTSCLSCFLCELERRGPARASKRPAVLVSHLALTIIPNALIIFSPFCRKTLDIIDI